MAVRPTITVRQDKLLRQYQGLTKFADMRVMVGIPSSTSMRDDGEPITNAALGYIHEHGAPEAHIPPRPWLRVTIAAMQPEIIRRLRQAAKYALDGKPEAMERALYGLGLAAQNKLRAKVNSNIPPPLAPRTIAERQRKGIRSTRTLVRTGAFRNSITFVIRSVSTGRDWVTGKAKGA